MSLSIEDKFNEVRAELHRVRGQLEGNIDATDPEHITAGLRHKLVVVDYMLRFMDGLDRNGPVEPL